MADIDLRHAHSLGHDEARTATQQIAEQLEQRIDVTYRWDGDVLHFDRSGAKGRIEVGMREVRVVMTLGWLLKPMRGQIRSEAKQLLDEHL